MIRKIIMLASVLMLVVCLALTPGAQAASSGGAYVYLYDSGETSADATCDWYAKVDQPSFILADSETDLVLDVIMVAHNGTGAIADGTYKVAVTVSDGTASVAANVTIVTSVAKTGTITIAAASLATLAKVDNGTVTYRLYDSTDVLLDTYAWTSVTINADQVAGAMYAIIPLVISIMTLAIVFSAIGGMFGKLNGFGKFGGRRKK